MLHVKKKLKRLSKNILTKLDFSSWLLYDHAGKSCNDTVAIKNRIYRQLQLHSFELLSLFEILLCSVFKD